ncbi:Alpha subunit of the F1 sector of mitochondrial F1F0 ATP synthase [Ascosphaera pollenicola]|nr:Alpha subunit of the F1 sector of mitochondrial F1F0 ATP synthase [Ascosphaera pollenicola]
MAPKKEKPEKPEKGDDGKQIVYHAIQEPEEEASPEEIEALKKEIELLRDGIANRKLQEREARASLTALAAHTSTSSLRAIVDELVAEHAAILARLKPMRQSGAETEIVTPERQEAVGQEWETWKKHLIRRKKICREMWYRCTEVLPEGVSNKEEMWESLGLEGQL